MTPTYDQPLLSTLFLTGDSDFATVADRHIPLTMNVVKGPLKASQVVGISGIVKTAGTGTITIGTSTSPSRYGTFTVKAGLAANTALVGELVLTEEGTRMGVSDIAAKVEAALVSFDGTIVVTDLAIVVGHYY